jgi:hydroxyacylglutathione hydrolase
LSYEIVPIETASLGDRSYVVHDGTDALVIDPQRDIDRVLTVLAEKRLRLRAVFETHVHNDYVTGGRALATATGATYYLNADDPVRFDRSEIHDGDVIQATDELSLEAVHTPGHTFTHLSYLLRLSGDVVAAFTGGSLLYGSVGRPDLVSADSTSHLAHAQYASAHRLAERAPDEAQVMPTHGFGSFCSASQSEKSESTIGVEKETNPVLTQDEETFVRELLAGLDAYPAYYAHMAPLNLEAPDSAPDLTAPRITDARDLRERIDAGEWVVDLRSRAAFTTGHVPGTLNFGLDGSFVTYLGWTIPWGTPLTIISDSPEDIGRAHRELVRIGIDRLAAAAVGTPSELARPHQPGSLRRVTFREVESERAQRPIVVLDVRRNQEWHEGHVEGALHVPLHELPERAAEVPSGEVWVHCGSGYRAAIAASMLANDGREMVLIDDDWENAQRVGVRISDPKAAR